ncbi:hypothetical protein, partial [Nostoc sp. 'Peltigera membranacea cyanobiont' 213]|uniref:hypothetical protein n=1 Tax=Nostoc sp. 'Peltigera membranacea cyanobiont' 213 TaxID=2014530 RepID=UPI001CB89B5E
KSLFTEIGFLAIALFLRRLTKSHCSPINKVILIIHSLIIHSLIIHSLIIHKLTINRVIQVTLHRLTQCHPIHRCVPVHL